jgi:hypothetical protein
VKTSNCPVPESLDVASEERKKWNSQVLLAAALGMLKVRRVVTSVVWPSLKILPAWRLKCTAPVQTSYCDLVVGLMMLAPEVMFCGEGEGRADAKPRMARVVAAVSNCIVIVVVVFWWVFDLNWKFEIEEATER